MKKIFCLLAMAFATTAIAAQGESQIIQKALLKNGSVLYGYIQQNDGLGSMMFQTDSAVIFLDNAVVDVTDRTVSYNMLQPEWQQWGKSHGALIGQPNSQSLVLNDLSIRSVADSTSRFMLFMKSKQLVSNVRLLERGVKFKYVELTPNSYRITWSDVVSITAEPRPATALSGIDRIYQTKDGVSYEGQYAGESGTTMSLYLPSGIMQTINKSDVIKYSYRPVNPDQTIFGQSPLLDEVHIKNQPAVKGVIIEQNYASSKDADNYILLQQTSGTIQSIRLSDIVAISKLPNESYDPQYDIIVPTDSVFVNREQAHATTFTTKKGVNTLTACDPVKIAIGAKKLTSVSVEYNASVGANVELYHLVKLSVQQKGKKSSCFFTGADILNSVYRPVSIKTSVNGTTKAVYQISGTGMFVLYNPQNGKCYPFAVNE